jgi:hypothetical protein
VNPEGSVAWVRDFDLAPVLDNVERFLDVQEKAGVTSSTLTSRALRQAAEQSGLLTDDDDSDEIEEEIRLGIEAAEAQRVRDAQAFTPPDEEDEDDDEEEDRAAA